MFMDACEPQWEVTSLCGKFGKRQLSPVEWSCRSELSCPRMWSPCLAHPCPGSQGVSEQCHEIPALPWAGKLLAASQRGRWEGSWEEYLIQLEDRSETAATEREKTSTLGHHQHRQLRRTQRAFLQNSRKMLHGENWEALKWSHCNNVS